MESKLNILRDSILTLHSFTGTDWVESSFLRFDFWMVDKLDTLKAFDMWKSTWLNLSGWRFAALIDMANPLEYFLRYRGNLILVESAIQADCRFTKVKGSSMVMTCLGTA